MARVRREVRVGLSPTTDRMGPPLVHVREFRTRAGKNLVPRLGILRQSCMMRLVMTTLAYAWDMRDIRGWMS